MIKTVKLVLFYLGYQLLFSALMLGLSLLTPISPVAQTGWALLLSGLAMGAHLILAREVSAREVLRPLPMRLLAACIVCIFCALMGFNALNELSALPNLLEQEFSDLSRTFYGVVSLVIVAPVMEELLFRGAIMGHLLRQGRSPRTAILLSALVFGLIHINPAQVVFAFLMGCVLGWVAWRTGSLWPAIAGHMLNNAMGVVEMALFDTDKLLPPDSSAYPTATLVIITVVGLALAGITAKWIGRHTADMTRE